MCDTETARQPNKRRKRKSNTPASTTNTPPGIKQKRSPMQCQYLSVSSHCVTLLTNFTNFT